MSLVVMASLASGSHIQFLGPLGYSSLGYNSVATVSPSLLPPRSALDVLPQSLSAYPGSSTFFNQFPGLRGFPALAYAPSFIYPANIAHLAHVAPAAPLAPAALAVAQAPAVSDVVDVAEEEAEEAPIVTVAHTIEAIPSPPRSPFRVELPNIPAGIGAQSTQPIFTHQLFKNPKFAAHGLFVLNSKDSPVLREIQAAAKGKATGVALL
jgi:hypothetical protein